ncbi:MAG TPA: hypothetical protein ENI23_02720 [bacterium]|nr:hypothetical protein [bacterium]
MRNEENRKKKFPITIVLDNIRSALNVGAIFRTCDAAGVDATNMFESSFLFFESPIKSFLK